MMRRGLTRIELLVILAVFLVLLSCLGLGLPGDIVFSLLFGWVLYLARVMPQVRPDPGVWAMAAACLLGSAAGLHSLLRWLYEQPVADPDPAQAARPKLWRPRWTATIVVVVVLMFVAGVAAVGVAHQTGWLLTSREALTGSGGRVAAWRAASTNNLKQMGLGVENYRQQHATYPAGGTFDARGKPLHGWQTEMLPYLEYAELYGQIDRSVPWDDPRNRAVFATPLNVYLNPGLVNRPTNDSAGRALSHYAGNARLLGARAVRDIADGTSQTILAGEVPDGFRPWGHPVNWRDPALGINRSPEGFGGPYAGGTNMLFADGSVRFLKNTIDPRVLKSLSTPDGGDSVAQDAY